MTATGTVTAAVIGAAVTSAVTAAVTGTRSTGWQQQYLALHLLPLL
jgi:hypothetical protein